MIHKLKRQLLAGPYLLWIIGFTILPLVMILLYAFKDSTGAYTLNNLTAIAQPIHLKALGMSLKLALLATVICLFLAYPLALILHNLQLKYKDFIVFLFILPMWMNFMLRILAWQLILSNNGIFNHILQFLHLPTQRLLYTQTAVVFGMVYDFLPFMILPIYNAVSRISPDVIDAARDLGANAITILRKITLPLSLSGVISGIIMVFVPSLTSFVVSNLLGGGKVLLIGNVIEQEFMQSMDWNLGSGLSIILMIFVLCSMALTNKLDKNGEGAMIW